MLSLLRLRVFLRRFLSLPVFLSLSSIFLGLLKVLLRIATTCLELPTAIEPSRSLIANSCVLLQPMKATSDLHQVNQSDCSETLRPLDFVQTTEFEDCLAPCKHQWNAQASPRRMYHQAPNSPKDELPRTDCKTCPRERHLQRACRQNARRSRRHREGCQH